MLDAWLPFTRDSLQQDTHNNIISIAAGILVANDYYVIADHINWIAGKPPKLGKHIPDIYAVRENTRIIVEVETRDSFNTNHAISQLKEFNAQAENMGAVLHLILPFYRIGLNEHIEKACWNILHYKLNRAKVFLCDMHTKEIKAA